MEPKQLNINSAFDLLNLQNWVPIEGRTIFDMKQENTRLKQRVFSSQISHLTGCSQLDKYLSGGISTNSVTEICGEGGTGKSQFCFQLGLNSLLTRINPQNTMSALNRGWVSRNVSKMKTNLRPKLSGRVMMVTTQKRYSEQRFQEMALGFMKRNELGNEVDVFNYFQISHINSFGQLSASMGATLKQIKELSKSGNQMNTLMSSDQTRLKMIIIDSVNSFLTELESYKEKFDGYRNLGKTLRELAREEVSVVVVNSSSTSFMKRQNNSSTYLDSKISSGLSTMSSKHEQISLNKIVQKKPGRKIGLGIFWDWVADQRYELSKVEGYALEASRMFRVWFGSNIPEIRLKFSIKSECLEFSEIREMAVTQDSQADFFESLSRKSSKSKGSRGSVRGVYGTCSKELESIRQDDAEFEKVLAPSKGDFSKINYPPRENFGSRIGLGSGKDHNLIAKNMKNNVHHIDSQEIPERASKRVNRSNEQNEEENESKSKAKEELLKKVNDTSVLNDVFW